MLTLLPLPAINMQGVMVALAMGMVMTYAFLYNKATDLLEDNVNTTSLPIDEKHKNTLIKIACACLIVPLLWLWQTPKILVIYLVFGGLLGFLYSYPVQIGKKSYRLKNILFIKNLTPAVSVAACTVLPSYFLLPNFPQIYFLFYAISIFSVVLCVEILCDIRDIDGDRRAGIKTLPNTLGVAMARTIALLIYAGGCLWFYYLLHFSMPPPSLIAGQMITFLIILFTTAEKPYWYFHLPIFMGAASCFIALASRYL